MRARCRSSAGDGGHVDLPDVDQREGASDHHQRQHAAIGDGADRGDIVALQQPLAPGDPRGGIAQHIQADRRRADHQQRGRDLRRLGQEQQPDQQQGERQQHPQRRPPRAARGRRGAVAQDLAVIWRPDDRDAAQREREQQHLAQQFQAFRRQAQAAQNHDRLPAQRGDPGQHPDPAMPEPRPGGGQRHQAQPLGAGCQEEARHGMAEPDHQRRPQIAQDHRAALGRPAEQQERAHAARREGAEKQDGEGEPLDQHRQPVLQRCRVVPVEMGQPRARGEQEQSLCCEAAGDEGDQVDKHVERVRCRHGRAHPMPAGAQPGRQGKQLGAEIDDPLAGVAQHAVEHEAHRAGHGGRRRRRGRSGDQPLAHRRIAQQVEQRRALRCVKQRPRLIGTLRHIPGRARGGRTGRGRARGRCARGGRSSGERSSGERSRAGCGVRPGHA